MLKIKTLHIALMTLAFFASNSWAMQEEVKKSVTSTKKPTKTTTKKPKANPQQVKNSYPKTPYKDPKEHYGGGYVMQTHPGAEG